MAEGKFLGIKQITRTEYEAESPKKNYLYLVRDDINVGGYDIYLKEMHYGHYNSSISIEEMHAILSGFSEDYTVMSAITETLSAISALTASVNSKEEALKEANRLLQEKLDALITKDEMIHTVTGNDVDSDRVIYVSEPVIEYAAAYGGTVIVDDAVMIG